jgi:uncharacterized protein
MAIDEKPSRNEDEYFAKVNAELLRAQRAKLDEERARAEREARKQACFMKCPKCGGELREETHGPLKIDRCADCTGVWLDPGELELLGQADRESRGSFLSGLFARSR